MKGGKRLKTRRVLPVYKSRIKQTRRTKMGRIHKVNCNPNVAGQTSVDKSCLPDNILNALKDAYNVEHPYNTITKTEPEKIWEELQDRLNTCYSEDCWLNIINDVQMRSKLNDALFAPKQPDEWKIKPNTWLSNIDIRNVLLQYETPYSSFKTIGPSAIDFDKRPALLYGGDCVTEELCNFNLSTHLKNNINKFGIVFNLDKHDEPGSHWVSLYIDLDDKIIFYFDSVGTNAPIEIKRFVKRIIKQGTHLDIPIKFKFIQNSPLAHQYGNTECGMYSLFFIITMLTNRVEGTKFKTLQNKIDFFTKQRVPDNYISQFRNIYFNT